MKPQLTLGQLIDKLQAISRDTRIDYDFADLSPDGIDSWRGIYSQLALGYDADSEPTVGNVLDWCVSAIGSVYHGYKGGSYLMDRSTPVWVANYGKSGSTAVLDVLDLGYWAIIETGYREP